MRPFDSLTSGSPGVGEAVMHAPCGGSVVVDAGVFVENIVVSRNLSIYRCKLIPTISGFQFVIIIIMNATITPTKEQPSRLLTKDT